MRLIKKALPALLLYGACVVTGLSQDAWGADAEKAATSTATPPAVELSFKEEPDPYALQKKYPFMKDFLNEVIEADKAASQEISTTFLLASSSAEKGGKDLIFLNLQGPEYCGSLGCANIVYVKSDDEYKVALNTTTMATLKLVNNAEKTQLILCTGPNGSVWDLKDGEFAHVDGTNDQTPHPACAASSDQGTAPPSP